MNNFPFLAQRLFNVPHAILPGKAEIIVAALSQRLGIAQFARADGTVIAFAVDDDYAEADAPERTYRRDPGYDNIAGVAVIPVRGTLVRENNSVRPYSGMTGYDGIRSAFMRAIADEAVEAIALDVDSPGGEVAGCFDLADTIYQARAAKPSWAILSESAYSAAYALASACSRITVPRTGGTGSIGTICMHVDLSEALGKAGIKVTLVTFGARKADLTETAPISRDALAALQRDVDACGEMFVDLVARNRKLAPAAVRSQEAGVFMGELGVTAGLADAVAAPDAAFRALLQSISRS